MPPLSERVELRLDSEILDRLDAWRDDQTRSLSRSEAIRLLLDEGIRATEKTRLRPTHTERLMLWMQAETLKHTIEAKGGRSAEIDLKTVSLIQEAIYGGHFWALDWEMTGVLHGQTDDPAKVTAVVDAMDMWTFIERAYASLNNAEKAALKADLGYSGDNPQFSGFDGNNETEYMAIARFLVQKLGRFEAFEGRSLNSHSPKVDRYARMAKAFEPIRAKLIGREMSASELREVLSIH